MFNYIHIQVIFVRIFLSFLGNNLSQVNEVIENRALKEQTIFEAFGMKVWIRERESGFYLSFEIGGENLFETKLGKTAVITKGVLNRVNVWAHKSITPLHEKAIVLITHAIYLVGINEEIKKIGILDRLFYIRKEIKLDLGYELMNQIIDARIVVRRSIFNKLTVFVEVETPTGNGPVSTLFPVFNGVMRDYHANLNKDPVNVWLHEILLNHVENHLS